MLGTYCLVLGVLGWIGFSFLREYQNMMRSGAISEEAGVVGVTVVYLFLAVLLVGMFVFSIWVAFREDGATKRK